MVAKAIIIGTLIWALTLLGGMALAQDEPLPFAMLEVYCEGNPARYQTCTGYVVQEKGPFIWAAAVSDYFFDPPPPTAIQGDGLFAWRFEVSFAAVPCGLDEPYVHFYLGCGSCGSKPDPRFANVYLQLDCISLPLVLK